MLFKKGAVCGQPVRGKVTCFGKQIDRSGDSAIGSKHWQVSSGAKAHGRDQRVVEENSREFGGGVGDKGLGAGDAEIMPRVAFQRFRAMGRVFHRVGCVDAAKQALRQIMGGYGEQPRAKRGAILFKGGKDSGHGHHIAMRCGHCLAIAQSVGEKGDQIGARHQPDQVTVLCDGHSLRMPIGQMVQHLWHCGIGGQRRDGCCQIGGCKR